MRARAVDVLQCGREESGGRVNSGFGGCDRLGGHSNLLGRSAQPPIDDFGTDSSRLALADPSWLRFRAQTQRRITQALRWSGKK